MPSDGGEKLCSMSSLSAKFSDLKVIAGGGSGIVFAGVDEDLRKEVPFCKNTSANVALKRLTLKGKGHCRVALREVRLLKRFQHENVISALKVVDVNGASIDDPSVENFRDLDSVFIVQELLDLDLHSILETHGKLSVDHAKLYMYQLLRGLKYIHSANVLHRDIKPGNLFVRASDLTLKIGDFGLARVFDDRYDHKGYLTAVVTTRYYRAPEVMLDLGNYSFPVDVWSSGCVLAEMLLGKVLFPGDNDIDQLNIIARAFGLRTECMRTDEGSFPAHLFAGHPAEAVDLLKKMLTIDPTKRISVEDALCHPFFASLHDPYDEPVCSDPFYVEHEVDNLPLKVLKRKILRSSCSNSIMNKSSYHASEENLFTDFDETFHSSKMGCYRNNSFILNNPGNVSISTASESTGQSSPSTSFVSSPENFITFSCISDHSAPKIVRVDSASSFLPSLHDIVIREELNDEPFLDPGRREHYEEEAPSTQNDNTMCLNCDSPSTEPCRTYFSDLSPVINVSSCADFCVDPSNSFLGIPGHSSSNNLNHRDSCACEVSGSSSGQDNTEWFFKKDNTRDNMNNEILNNLTKRTLVNKITVNELVRGKLPRFADGHMDSMRFWI